MIGAKSIATLLLLALTTAVVWAGGYLDAAHLTRLGPWAACLLGLFAHVCGFLLYRLWRLDEPSSTGFRYTTRDSRFDVDVTLFDHMSGKITIGQSTADPWDLPPGRQRLLCTVSLLWVGLVAFDNQSFDRLEQLPRRVQDDAGQFCPEPGPEEEERPPAPEAQGCELVRRAYALGYAESLGPCEPEADEADEEPCALRQRDEPYLHYAWRLLEDRTRPLLGALGLSALRRFKRRLGAQLDHLGSLYGAQRQSLADTPRAAHHLWTTLPAPGSASLSRPGHCLAQTSHVSERWNLPDGAAGRGELVERVLGQLLFDPRYKPIVGVCGEYVVHWAAPRDACRQLARDPERFLAAAGALDPVREVLLRYQRELELGRLDGIARPRELAASRVHERIVSFQCLIEGRRGAGRRIEHAFTLDGRRFQAAELQVSARGGKERSDAARGGGATHASARGRSDTVALFRHLALLLARGFHYGQLMSRGSPAPGDGDVSFEDLFAGGDYLLTKAEYLRTADLFLTGGAIGHRQGALYEVYPYHLHVRRFVEVFRRQYALQRGRL